MSLLEASQRDDSSGVSLPLEETFLDFEQPGMKVEHLLFASAYDASTPAQTSELLLSDVSRLRGKGIESVLNNWMQKDAQVDSRSNVDGNTLILRRVLHIGSVSETDILEIKPEGELLRISWGSEQDFENSRFKHSISFSRKDLHGWPNLKKALAPTLANYDQWLKNNQRQSSEF